MTALKRCSHILFWAEKHNPVQPIVFQARPLVMLHPAAEPVSADAMRLYKLHRHCEQISNDLALTFLSVAERPGTLPLLVDHLRCCADKEELSRDDHQTIGRYLGFGQTTIDLMLKHNGLMSRPKAWQHEFKL